MVKMDHLFLEEKLLLSQQFDNLAIKIDDYATRFAGRNGGYTRILKLTERKGDDALMVILEVVEG